MDFFLNTIRISSSYTMFSYVYLSIYFSPFVSYLSYSYTCFYIFDIFSCLIFKTSTSFVDQSF